MIARCFGLVFAIVFFVHSASAADASHSTLQTDFKVFFAAKPPWSYPVAKDTGDLAKLAQEAQQDYRTVEPRLKLQRVNTFEDSEHHLLFLAFEIAQDSPVYRTDFYLVYVYDRSHQRFVGRVHIPMA
jgi:hypothetical protein